MALFNLTAIKHMKLGRKICNKELFGLRLKWRLRSVPDLLYLGWWWVTCIFRALFETFVLSNRDGGGCCCYLSLSRLYLLSFTVFILQPVQAMQPSSQSVQYPAVSYPPQHLLPVSPTQQFSVVLKIFIFFFFFPWSWSWGCEHEYAREPLGSTARGVPCKSPF